jgi:NAD(P)-dependent dehydrogenase (short-subunit alcohol dehydrogenase family)
VFELNGGAALVTGASSGIGAAIAVGLAARGVPVACAGRDSARLEAVCDAITARGGSGVPIVADLGVSGIADRLVSDAAAQVGEIRFAVNCAATNQSRKALDISPSEWDHIQAVNLRGLFQCCQAEARHMAAASRGSIVNIASVSAHIANRGWTQAHYNASKAGVTSLTRSLAVEWAQLGIRVNAVSPGYTEPSLVSRRERLSEDSETRNRAVTQIPMGRWASAEEMVGPVVFLLSEAASYCTGAEIVVDGGATCW